MNQCPSCSLDVPDGSRFCGSCGSSLDPFDARVTETSVSAGPASSGSPGGTGAHSPGSHTAAGVESAVAPEDSRFVPGTMLVGRYRIVGLLGRGGMGEVYRADDLKLGQPVALKVLPEALESDPGRLQRFLNEVRSARQVSHPNVCRVYDIGEVADPVAGAGQPRHFLSMEYVDGEELASLLRRIGRLPDDKAVEVARQICAGLAAIHSKGLLHRDLKPSNVMIDGQGQVRITDFGLAGVAAGFEGAEIRVGTPAYMAPEQISGREVSVRSDIWALGLVLYELFTGKPAFDASTREALIRSQEDSSPASPSTLVPRMDPAVERVILRCLERDPERRPESAITVAAALPGGDPLAAALAAGETPSPQMVAHAGAVGGLKPWIAALALTGIVAGFAASIWMWREARLVERVSLDKPPAALIVEAREMARRLGHEGTPADTAHGWVVDRNYLGWAERRDSGPNRWDGLATVRPAPVQFWYRESPRALVPANFGLTVTPNSPPVQFSGMVNLWLDPDGRLSSFLAVPPQLDERAEPGPETDWGALFAEAGLDPDAFTPVRPVWNPMVYCDRRAAWDGNHPGQPEIPIRIEAGSYRGTPVYFQIVSPWSRPGRMVTEEDGRQRNRVANAILIVLLLVVLSAGMLLARRNVRLGRSDRRGAFRMATYIFCVVLLGFVFETHHVATLAEVGLLFSVVRWGLLFAGMVWLVYMGLEPYVRKIWPNALISWTRLLSLRFRDPLVGSDILIGSLAGVFLTTVNAFSIVAPSWLGQPPSRPSVGTVEVLSGVNHIVGRLFSLQPGAMFVPILLFFLIVLLRAVLKKHWLAVGAAFVIMAGISLLQGAEGPLDWALAALIWTVLIAVTIRRGLLAAVSAFFVANVLMRMPVTADLSAWYAPWGAIALAAVVAVVAYGFVTSLSGRPLIGDFLEAD
jgi:serine/threonine-protein kinase